MRIELLAMALIAIFAFTHSLFASPFVKGRIPLKPQPYRIGFSLVALLSYFLLSRALCFLGNDPHHVNITPLIPPDARIKTVLACLKGAGFVFLVGTLAQINPLKFLGLLAENPQKDLQERFFYRFSRHPMYFGGVLILLPDVFVMTNSVWITHHLLLSVYLVIGSFLEERRFRGSLKGYSDFRKVRGFFFPWRKRHFQVLLGRQA